MQYFIFAQRVHFVVGCVEGIPLPLLSPLLPPSAPSEHSCVRSYTIPRVIPIAYTAGINSISAIIITMITNEHIVDVYLATKKKIFYFFKILLTCADYRPARAALISSNPAAGGVEVVSAPSVTLTSLTALTVLTALVAAALTAVAAVTEELC